MLIFHCENNNIKSLRRLFSFSSVIILDFYVCSVYCSHYYIYALQKEGNKYRALKYHVGRHTMEIKGGGAYVEIKGEERMFITH